MSRPEVVRPGAIRIPAARVTPGDVLLFSGRYVTASGPDYDRPDGWIVETRKGRRAYVHRWLWSTPVWIVAA